MGAVGLVTKRVRLDPIGRSDYDALLRLSVHEPDVWSWGLQSPNPETFVDSLWRNILAQFMIRPRESNNNVGIVRAYAPNLHHGHCYISVILFPEFRTRGWPLEGCAIFLRHLFQQFPLKKIYAETTDVVLTQLFDLTTLGFVVEGRLRDHLLVDGKRRDYVIIALHRDEWDATWPRIEGLLLGTREGQLRDGAALSFSEFQRRLADALGVDFARFPGSIEEANIPLSVDSLQRIELVLFLEEIDPTEEQVPEAMIPTLVSYADVYHYYRLRLEQSRKNS